MSGLRIVDMTVFCGRNTIAAVHDVAACQLAACGFNVAERPPAVEVNVNLRGALHVDVQVTRFRYTHEIESRIRGCGKTV